jgi:hypothetical protein
MILVSTAAAWAAADVDPRRWEGFGKTLLGYVGIEIGGGGGITAPATEAQKVETWNDVLPGFYAEGNRAAWSTLSALVILAVVIAFVAILWKRDRPGLFLVAWLIVLLGMVWPGAGQVRFVRMWWGFIPVMAGIGIATVLSWLKDLSFDPSWEWLKKFQNPLLFALLMVLVFPAFVLNAFAEAERVTPPTEWRGGGVDEAFMEAFDWIRANTPENSIFSIQWSFGHVFTGTTKRPTVCDGCETVGLEGEWEENFPSPPPDYIFYVEEDGRTPRYGIETSRRIYRINGRRIDVEWFPRITAHELEYYLKEYRDEWGVRIDYIIFSADEYWTAANLYGGNTRATLRNHDLQRLNLHNLLFGRGEPEARTDQFVENNNKLIFDFGRKGRVILDRGTFPSEVYSEDGGHLQGHALLWFEGGEIMWLGGRIVGFRGTVVGFDYFAPPRTPQVYETLVVFQDDARGIFEAWLVKNPLGEYLEAGYENVPYPNERIGVKAFTGNLGDVGYLDLAFKSTNGNVVVLKVDHRLI